MENNFVENYIRELKKTLDGLPLNKVREAASLILETFNNNKQVFIMGNGGSAVNASHFACDLSKGTLKRLYDPNEKRFRVTSLTDNIATITAYANDLSYEDIFVQQLRNLAQPEDLIIVLSGSGKSSNIIRVLQYAKEINAKTIALLGFDGGEAIKMADCPILVPSNHYGRIEDTHLVLHHLITSYFYELKTRD